jgi:hypothetical protein
MKHLLKRAVNVLTGGVDWETLYEEQHKEAIKWECKYNTLHRQLSAILKER